MLKQKDLEAAVAAGIISEQQADELNDFAASRHAARSFAAGRDERFRLLGGFNDFFVAIGVVLLASGIWFGAAKFSSAAIYLVGIFALWALAEYLTAIRRLTAPSIAISIFLAIFAAMAASGLTGSTIFTSGAALATAALHYLRFRFPFTLAVAAVAGLMCILSAVGLDLTAGNGASYQTIFFFYGLALFAVAMWFDSSDTQRLTRRADKGFWLHLVAAPMIVHPLVRYVADRGQGNEGDAALLVVLIAALLAFIAVLIDRRALVVVSLGYLGGAIAYGVSQLSGSEETGATATLTLLFLGTIIIVLGVGWHQIRYRLMQLLPIASFKFYLPPVKEPT